MKLYETNLWKSLMKTLTAAAVKPAVLARARSILIELWLSPAKESIYWSDVSALTAFKACVNTAPADFWVDLHGDLAKQKYCDSVSQALLDTFDDVTNTPLYRALSTEFRESEFWVVIEEAIRTLWAEQAETVCWVESNYYKAFVFTRTPQGAAFWSSVHIWK